MANEYQRLATIEDETAVVTIEIRRMYQEDGGRGYEFVVMRDETTFVDAVQVRDVIPARRSDVS